MLLAIIILIGVGIAANLIGIFGSVVNSKGAADQYYLIRVISEVGDQISQTVDRVVAMVAVGSGHEVHMTQMQLREALQNLEDPRAIRSATRQMFFREIFVRCVS